MTVPVEVKATTKVTKRKQAVRRGYNDLGKFFQKIRIDLDMTSTQWAKAISVSPMSISEMERGDKELNFEIALKIHNLLEKEAPQYSHDFAHLIANKLQVLLIPVGTSDEAVNTAYNTLKHFDQHHLKVQVAE